MSVQAHHGLVLDLWFALLQFILPDIFYVCEETFFGSFKKPLTI
jgi:hypothetical protein